MQVPFESPLSAQVPSVFPSVRVLSDLNMHFKSTLRAQVYDQMWLEQNTKYKKMFDEYEER